MQQIIIFVVGYYRILSKFWKLFGRFNMENIDDFLNMYGLVMFFFNNFFLQLYFNINKFNWKKYKIKYNKILYFFSYLVENILF